MNTRQINLPLEAIINLLKSLDARAREEIFEEVFIECDSAPLSKTEEKALNKAIDEYKRGETIPWMDSK